MAIQLINVGTEANSKNGDLLRTAFIKINENFTELYSTDNSTKYHLGDDVQFVNIDPDSGTVVIQSGFDTSMPVYIKGANCSDGGVGGNVVIEAGGAPLPNNGTTGNIELAAQQTTIDSNNNIWTFGDDGTLNLPESVSEGNAIIQTTSAINLQVNSNGKVWTLDTDGNLTLPEGGAILDSTGTNILDGLGGGTPSNIQTIATASALIPINDQTPQILRLDGAGYTFTSGTEGQLLTFVPKSGISISTTYIVGAYGTISGGTATTYAFGSKTWYPFDGSSNLPVSTAVYSEGHWWVNGGTLI